MYEVPQTNNDQSESQITGNAETPNRVHGAEEEFRREETSEFDRSETPVLIQKQ